MNKIQSILNTILAKLNFLSSDNKVSITNLTVAVFVLITAFRALFGGGELVVPYFDWKIAQIDYASVLPLLFSLLNYHAKRMTIDNNKSTAETVDIMKGNS